MNFIGDYFAISLVLILSLFYFDRKNSLNTASRYFIGSLAFTAMTAGTNIATGSLMENPGTPLWMHMTVNTLYFLVNILSTSFIALYLFTKILEHSYNRHCMRNALIGLGCCLAVYGFFLLANVWTGWLFYFDAAGVYRRGPLNALGYWITIVQMGLVIMCYVRNRKNASSNMSRVLIQTFPIVLLVIVIQRVYPEIMLNSFAMTMMEIVLFLTFNGQRPGVHSLTRLNDRHRFFEDLERRKANQESVQIFMLNIKNLNVVNQKYGHMFGDELLYQFAFALERLIKTGSAFHMSGAVFAITIAYGNQHTAEKHLSRVLEFLESGIEFGGEHIELDYVAVEYLADSREFDAAQIYEMLEYAAAEAYRNKERYIRCTAELRDKMTRRRYLIERLQHIDREHGFRTWFQPVRCMKTGKFCSMEALVRLVEPDGSIISPAEFIPVAEQAGMIAPITWFVLEDVCRALRDHPELNGVSVGVNLPMVQMLGKDFRVRLNSIVNQYGIDHERICLEFTERAIPENFEQAQQTMWELRRDGYHFYLDDFGEGYSNFNCLLQLPFRIIKLDTCLVHTKKNGVPDYSTVGTLTKLFHDMNLIVVAEGAETEEEVQMLEAQGVDRIQGFALARPMPADALMKFYQEHPLNDLE